MPIARDTILAITLAVLMVLSGCSGVIPGDGQTPDSPTPFAHRSYDEAVDNHSAALRETGQFKLRWVRSVTFPERVVNRSPVSNELVADFESDRYLMGPASEEDNLIYQDGAAYQSGSTTWQRIELDNGSMAYYRLPSDDPFSVRKSILHEIWTMENFSKQFPVERNGTAVFQGRTVARYTTDKVGQAERCLFDSRYVIANVTSIEVVALIDNRGIIRKFECQLSGETTTGERFTERRLWTITGIGIVEIREPDPLVNETRGG